MWTCMNESWNLAGGMGVGKASFCLQFALADVTLFDFPQKAQLFLN